MLPNERRLTLVHPGAEDVHDAFTLAPRLASLQGIRIGLIDNRKRNSDIFFDKLKQLLREQHGVSDFQYYTKDSASVPTPDDVMEDMTRNCQAVIHAVAD